MTEVLAHLVQLPAQVVVVVALIHVIQEHLAAAVGVVALAAALEAVFRDKVLLEETLMVEDMVVVVAQALLVNQQLLLNQVLTALVALAYFHTWMELVHFILVVVAQAQQILVAVLATQQLAAEQQQELVVVLQQIQALLETELQEQLIAEAQAEVHQLEMALIKELAEQAALV
jgi:hypothetical protein